MRRTRCRHCNSHRSLRQRGLCWACYFNRDIRALYPATEMQRGVRDYCGNSRLPEPVAIPPGPGKVEVMAARAAKGQSIFHPKDGPHDLA